MEIPTRTETDYAKGFLDCNPPLKQRASEYLVSNCYRISDCADKIAHNSIKKSMGVVTIVILAACNS